MIGRPEASEAAPYYFTYIDQVTGDNVVSQLETQLESIMQLLSGIPEERSLYRYAPDKWSIRQTWSHVNDAERVFVYRALWFARGFDSPLPSFDQNMGVAGANADSIPWKSHIEEFREIRRCSLAFFRNLPDSAWARSGIASDKPVTVRALAYVVAGHAAHHAKILRERYL
jgi:hypothetical protein